MRAIAYSHDRFNELCQGMGVNDENVETYTNDAFISIICTEDCRRYYLEEDKTHYFKRGHDNVLNIVFDDLTQDKDWNNYVFKAMSESQGEEIVNFIEKNKGKNFMVHCTAGISRSGAVASFIRDFYLNDEEQDLFERENPHIRPNIHVLSTLKRVYYEKNNIFK